MVQVDVCSDESISGAAAYLKSKGVTLYGLVNNAGVGIKTANEADLIMTTNFYGPKKVTDALVGFVDKRYVLHSPLKDFSNNFIKCSST